MPIAAVVLVVIAIVAGMFTGENGESRDGEWGSLASRVTGTTDPLTEAEASGVPSISPAVGRLEPSRAQWAELLPKLKKAAEADPLDVTAERKLALAYYNLGQLAEAKGIYEKLLQIKEDPVLRNRLGNTLRDMGRLAEAEGAYRKAIADDAAPAPPYLNLAELLWRQAKVKEAIAVLDAGLAAVPEDRRSALAAGRELLTGQEQAPVT